MTSQPDYLRYLESAKQAEVADQLRRDGFQVEQEKRLNDVVFDLVATKGGRTTAFAFKSAGHSRFSREEFRKLNAAAATAGYKLQIVVAAPPPRVNVEVDDLADHLLQYLIEHMPSELDSLSTHTVIEGMHDLAIENIQVGHGRIHVSGSASVDVTLQYGSSMDDGTSNSDAFPFRFTAVLDTDGGLREVDTLEFDTSDFDN